MNTSPTYQEGYKAYWEYANQNDCPYCISKILQELWMDGFRAARGVDNGDEVADEEFHKLLEIV